MEKEVQQNLPPPPPPFLSLELPAPTIAEHSYTMHYQKKHQAMINGEEEYESHKKEVQIKLAGKLQNCDRNAHQTQSVGTVQLRNLLICSKCHKCGHWVENQEMKTHMSFHVAKVMDRLLLGDKHSSMSSKQLFERNQVTHILNAAAELNNYFQGKGIKYLHLQLQDQVGQKVIPQALKGAHFIDESLREGGVVFVHCAMGKSRSVAAIIVYLMLFHNLNYQQSLALIRNSRPLAKPNISYEQQLKEFWQKRLQT